MYSLPAMNLLSQICFRNVEIHESYPSLLSTSTENNLPFSPISSHSRHKPERYNFPTGLSCLTPSAKYISSVCPEEPGSAAVRLDASPCVCDRGVYLCYKLSIKGGQAIMVKEWWKIKRCVFDCKFSVVGKEKVSWAGTGWGGNKGGYVRENNVYESKE